MKKRKVCIITGTRAEWGLFYPLAKEISRDKKSFELQIIATGAHLSEKYGLTYKEIENDGFVINKKVKVPLDDATEMGTAKSVSAGIYGITEALRSLRPKIVFLLGDRFETFAAAAACVFLKIPIAHIHGGELTEGSLDDAMRHAITKMSYLHFVSASVYRNRVIHMGEDASRVFNVGALGLDNVRDTCLLGKEAFERRTGFVLGRRNILVTFNPATAEDERATVEEFKNLLKVLDGIKDAKILFTKPNPDMHADTIVKLLDNYVSRNPKKCKSFVSMGRVLYLSALNRVDIVAGNSSSGIIEAPSFGIPTVNIGNRQKGREKASSVIDAKGDLRSIKKAVGKALSNEFKERCKKTKNIYGDGHTAKRIANMLKKADTRSVKKSFYDIKGVQASSYGWRRICSKRIY